MLDFLLVNRLPDRSLQFLRFQTNPRLFVDVASQGSANANDRVSSRFQGNVKMHAIELADLATVFAGLSSDMIALKCVPNRMAGQQYWLESRFRHDFWNSKLAAHRHDLHYQNVASRKRSWTQVMPLIEEVLLSEPLARCIAYHGRLLEDRQIDSDLAALSQSVLSSHVEARHRCLHLIVFGDGLAVEHSTRLNQLRRTLEGFNDSLLSFLKPIGSTDTFSFDPISVQKAQAARPSVPRHSLDSQLLQLSGLRTAFRLATARRIATIAPSQASNRKLHDAVTSFLPQSLFDSFGLPRSSLTARLQGESAEARPTVELLSQPQASSIGFLFESSRSRPRPASTEEGRW